MYLSLMTFKINKEVHVISYHVITVVFAPITMLNTMILKWKMFARVRSSLLGKPLQKKSEGSGIINYVPVTSRKQTLAHFNYIQANY